MKPLFALLLSAGVLSPQMIIIAKKKSGCTPVYSNERQTTQNATSPPGITEADATTGWTNNGAGTFDTAGTPQSGSYALNVVADGGNNDGTSSGFSYVAGTLHRLSVQVRHNGTGGNWSCSIGRAANFADTKSWTLTSTDTTYTALTFLLFGTFNSDIFFCRETSATNDGGVYIDSYSLTDAAPCLDAELHTSANAASLSSEANATTGFTAINSLNSLTSDATVFADGAYSIKADATTSPTAGNGVNIDLQALGASEGNKYILSYKLRHLGSGGAWRCGMSASSTGTSSAPLQPITNVTTNFYAVGYELEYAAASNRYFVCHEDSGTDNGGVYVDSLSLKRVVSE